jgi:hypothetical protein
MNPAFACTGQAGQLCKKPGCLKREDHAAQLSPILEEEKIVLWSRKELKPNVATVRSAAEVLQSLVQVLQVQIHQVHCHRQKNIAPPVTCTFTDTHTRMSKKTVPKSHILLRQKLSCHHHRRRHFRRQCHQQSCLHNEINPAHRTRPRHQPRSAYVHTHNCTAPRPHHAAPNDDGTSSANAKHNANAPH